MIVEKPRSKRSAPEAKKRKKKKRDNAKKRKNTVKHDRYFERINKSRVE